MTPRPTAATLDAILALRWRALWVQLAVAVTVVAVDAVDDLMPALAVLAVSAATNAALTFAARRGIGVTASAVPAAIALDVVLLTVLLGLTGGPMNPFSFLFVIHVATATVTLPTRHAWAIAGLTVVAYRVLFLPALVGDPHALHTPGMMALHLEGMWLAFAMTAGFVVHDVTRLRAALAAEERERLALAERARRLQALATLAGGAAHELSTPLATIALVASELSEAAQTADIAAVRADARLVLDEVERCRSVLENLSADAGAPHGEAPALRTIRELVTEVLTGVSQPVEVAHDDPEAVGRWPARTLSSALRGLVVNAHKAGGPVRLATWHDEATGTVTLHLDDHGPGLTPELAARIGEPFFTTRPEGQGMGLGVYLAVTVVEQIGGRLSFSRAPSGGCRVRVVLPLATCPGRST
ncbi:MAG: hypothetical protein RLZZ383_1755 [Pseudomonadota bacterium]|jgi:two-component system sensor histidine kinase RegB